MFYLYLFIYFFSGKTSIFQTGAKSWLFLLLLATSFSSSSFLTFLLFFIIFRFFPSFIFKVMFQINSKISNIIGWTYWWGRKKWKKKWNYELIDGFGYIYFVNIAHLNLTISMNSWMISVCAILIYLRFAVITFTNGKWKQIRYTWPYTYKCTHVRTTKTTTPAQRFYLISTVYFKIITQSPIYSIENFYFLFVANRLLNA